MEFSCIGFLGGWLMDVVSVLWGSAACICWCGGGGGELVKTCDLFKKICPRGSEPSAEYSGDSSLWMEV